MQIPAWLRWYKKPEYRDIKEYSTALKSGRRSPSPSASSSHAIPRRLRLERVLENKTCSPMSLYDFYMYLKHIEYSPENLEFYVWYKNYETNYAKSLSSKRFEEASTLGANSDDEKDSLKTKNDEYVHTVESYDPELAKGTFGRISDMISSAAVCTTNACKPSFVQSIGLSSPCCDVNQSNMDPYTRAITASSLDPQTELNVVVQAFLMPSGEKELNIPPAMREEALEKLKTSSDPEILRPIADHVYQLLRNCSHRNFVRLGVSNGTYETICVATGLGIVLTIAGFLLVLLEAFVPFRAAHTRWTAFASWPFWWLGMALVLSGLRGSCFFLLLFSRRQPLPWERFDDAASRTSEKSGIIKFMSRMMIFDRKVRVKDIHLRNLQTKIVCQSLLGGAIIASLLTLLFILLPVWSGPAL